MKRAQRRELRRTIQLIFQDPYTSLNPRMSVGEIVGEAFAIHPGAAGKGGRTKAVRELLDLVGLNPDHLNRYPHQFSGGMRQRVMIAMALAMDPEVLIADEPTTALDVTVQAQIMQLLAEIQAERQMALILITHDLGVVATVADDVTVMFAGRAVEQASVLDIYGRPAHPYTKALLRSIPRLDRKGGDLEVIPGRPPDLLAVPAGCPFHPRCERAEDICRAGSPPPVVELPGDRSAACHFAEEVVAGAGR
jgi:oligopeptide/dipeptide ABC transporter ATP-binding protein